MEISWRDYQNRAATFFARSFAEIEGVGDFFFERDIYSGTKLNELIKTAPDFFGQERNRLSCLMKFIRNAKKTPAPKVTQDLETANNMSTFAYFSSCYDFWGVARKKLGGRLSRCNLKNVPEFRLPNRETGPGPLFRTRSGLVAEKYEMPIAATTSLTPLNTLFSREGATIVPRYECTRGFRISTNQRALS